MQIACPSCLKRRLVRTALSALNLKQPSVRPHSVISRTENDNVGTVRSVVTDFAGRFLPAVRELEFYRAVVAAPTCRISEQQQKTINRFFPMRSAHMREAVVQLIPTGAWVQKIALQDKLFRLVPLLIITLAEANPGFMPFLFQPRRAWPPTWHGIA